LKHVEVFNVIHILQNKEIVHQVGNKNKFILWCTVRKTSNYTYLGSFFLDPEDIRKLSVGAIWNFAKGTGLL
jgi:hypothetical protein